MSSSRAAAGELCIKTNLPWVAFGDAEAVDASNSGRGEGAGAAAAAATGGAVGASGTTLLPPVGVIAPGTNVCSVCTHVRSVPFTKVFCLCIY